MMVVVLEVTQTSAVTRRVRLDALGLMITSVWLVFADYI